jgi:8-amino-7-oxononanoate synthase
MTKWQAWLQQQTNNLTTVRKRLVKTGGNCRWLLIEAQPKLNFISNDYLGLSSDQRLIEALFQASKQYGVGSTGAATLSGYSQEHKLLAAEMAQWLGRERCLLFNSGYQLNVSLLAALVDSNTYIWLDAKCHASHFAGVRLARARFSRFTTEELAQLATKIKQHTYLRQIIISEGCCSMDGSNSYLAQLLQIKQAHPENILLIIDDAHGFGTLGKQGHGSLSSMGIDLTKVDLLIGTFGKAFGAHGGFIAGIQQLIDYLQQTVTGQIYSTTLPPAIVAAARAALAIIKSAEGSHLRAKLAANIKYFQHLALKRGLILDNWRSNLSPIQLISFNGAEKLQQVHQKLYDRNLLVGKMLYPTVPKATPRLRISLNVLHQPTDLHYLVDSLAEVCYA